MRDWIVVAATGPFNAEKAPSFQSSSLGSHPVRSFVNASSVAVKPIEPSPYRAGSELLTSEYQI